VVVATRDRASSLRATLSALSRSLRPGDELIVVDSASRDAHVSALAEALGATVVRADTPGACRARNLGARTARCEVIAFTDDDCDPDPGWVAAVASAFTDHPETAFLTGRVLAGRGTRRRLSVSVVEDDTPAAFDASALPADGPVPEMLGHGANMAWRRSALDAIGGFDETLGPGAPLRAAEDQDAFWRALRVGLIGRYEPAAVVHHRQWRDVAGQLAAFYGYGVGTGGLCVKRWRIASAERAVPPTGGQMTAVRTAGGGAGGILRSRAGRQALRSVWDDGVAAVARRMREGYELGALAEAAGLAGALRGARRAWRIPVVGDHFALDRRAE
jgi:glycosyltransferase involved in cell wall biosynthesis